MQAPVALPGHSDGTLEGDARCKRYWCTWGSGTRWCSPAASACSPPGSTCDSAVHQQRTVRSHSACAQCRAAGRVTVQALCPRRSTVHACSHGNRNCDLQSLSLPAVANLRSWPRGPSHRLSACPALRLPSQMRSAHWEQSTLGQLWLAWLAWLSQNLLQVWMGMSGWSGQVMPLQTDCSLPETVGRQRVVAPADTSRYALVPAPPAHSPATAWARVEQQHWGAASCAGCHEARHLGVECRRPVPLGGAHDCPV